MLAHAQQGYPVEIAGYALGLPLIDTVTERACTYIDRVIKAECESTRTHVTLLPSGMHEVQKTCDETGLILVGYYHSHPGFSVFQSGEDVSTYQNYYPEPYQMAIVVDPTRTEAAVLEDEPWIGFFGWDGGRTPQRLPVDHLRLAERFDLPPLKVDSQELSKGESTPNPADELGPQGKPTMEQLGAHEARSGFAIAIDLRVGRHTWKTSMKGRLPRFHRSQDA
jgi:proteasome lid subunit RPN8/RPN11